MEKEDSRDLWFFLLLWWCWLIVVEVILYLLVSSVGAEGACEELV